MGFGRYDHEKYVSYAADAHAKSRAELFSRTYKSAPTKSGQEVNADKITLRESRDSEAHPVSTPVIVGLDVTGSMGRIPESLVKEGFGRFVNSLLQRHPIDDPHLLFLGIGDAVVGDKAPLQATQFEADERICDQLTDIWLEGGGGGNSYESYDLAWMFAARRTHTDCWEKRKAKGFLFTVGDEMFPQSSSRDYVQSVVEGVQSNTPEGWLAEAQERYVVFHVIIAEGDFARRDVSRVQKDWEQRLQSRALVLYDAKLLPEALVSAIALENGVQLEEVLGWWSEDVARSLRKTFKEKQ